MVKSALIGDPPLTDDDYWIVRSFLIAFGLPDVDPHQGIVLPPARPKDYHFETKGPGIIVGMVVSIVIMLGITSLRLWLRWKKNRLQFGADDWLIIPGALMAIAWPCLQIGCVTNGGAGKHMYDVTYYDYYVFNWLASVDKLLFFVSVGVIKMSIVMFNMRLTGLSSRRWMIAHWTFFGLLVIYTLAAFFMNVFQCIPAYGNFDTIRTGHDDTAPKCMSDSDLGTILSSIHVVMDFCLLAVPVAVLWRVQMSRKAKQRLFAVFSLGGMSFIGSILRQVEQSRLSSDVLWNFTGVLGWSLVDLTFGVIAASAPMLSAILPRAFKDSTHRPSQSKNIYGANTHRHNGMISTQGRSARLGSSETVDQVGIMVRDDIELTYHAANLGHAEKFESKSKVYAVSEEDGRAKSGSSS